MLSPARCFVTLEPGPRQIRFFQRTRAFRLFRPYDTPSQIGGSGLRQKLLVGRLMDINGFDDISPDLVTAARQTLVIGTQ